MDATVPIGKTLSTESSWLAHPPAGPPRICFPIVVGHCHLLSPHPPHPPPSHRYSLTQTYSLTHTHIRTPVVRTQKTNQLSQTNNMSSTPDQRPGEGKEVKAEEEAQSSPPSSSGTYECGCHCGFVKFAMTLSPPLPAYEVLQCNCSACTRFGYLLVYPTASQIQWHNDGRNRCAVYRFNTKDKDQLFCPKCGASLAIDFRDVLKPHEYGVSVRSIYGINLDELKYKKLDGMNRVPPAGDLSGHYWDEETGQMK